MHSLRPDWCTAPQFADGQRNKHMRTHHHNYHCALARRCYPAAEEEEDSEDEEEDEWEEEEWGGFSDDEAREEEEAPDEEATENDTDATHDYPRRGAVLPRRSNWAQAGARKVNPQTPTSNGGGEKKPQLRTFNISHDAVAHFDDALYAPPLPPRVHALRPPPAVEDFHFSDHEDPQDPPMPRRHHKLGPKTPIRKRPYEGHAARSAGEYFYTVDSAYKLGAFAQLRAPVARYLTAENIWERIVQEPRNAGITIFREKWELFAMGDSIVAHYRRRDEYVTVPRTAPLSWVAARVLHWLQRADHGLLIIVELPDFTHHELRNDQDWREIAARRDVGTIWLSKTQ
ncbi:hypothetical protein FN846DRAFT_906111 [Sphaerosporella brunnea]|uniref:Uncharacterized protein n=1 Tax=Sphaerosporella brunnea TaxID=1250544 RepID=A0A5J5EZ65_9PEZI|nr:hypothetical protein FN846DRAFT_906111 [Sphaerosporella brunnea]